MLFQGSEPISGRLGALAVRWALALSLLLATGCGDRDVTPEMKSFQGMINAFCGEHGRKLQDVVRQGKRAPGDEVLDGIFRRAAEAGKPLGFSLFILNKQEDLVAAHLNQRDAVEKSSLQAYREGRFRLPGGIKKVLSKGRTRPIRLYLQGGDELWMVVVPLKVDGRVAGAALISFHGEWITSQWGISADQFMSLELDG